MTRKELVSMISVHNHIKTIIYFDGITDDELVYITAHSRLKHYAHNETIFLEGEPAGGLWIVEQGRVKIYKLSADGAEHILHLRAPGQSFNDIAGLDGGLNPASAASLSADTQVWLVPSEVITHIVLQNPRVALNAIRLLAKRVRSLVDQIEDLALYSVIVRLARFLLKQAEDPGLSGPGVTRIAIAAYLNTTPQTISVALRELEAAGAIEFDRHQIRIIDEAALRAVAML